MTVVTVAERKAREIARLEAAGQAVISELRAYRLATGVRFSIFGSFARGEIVLTSDFDVLVQGPERLQREGRAAAEAACEHHGLNPDVYLAAEASPALMLRIERDALVLP